MTNVFKIVKNPDTFTFRAERLIDGKKSLLNDIKNTAEQMVADQRRKNGGNSFHFAQDQLQVTPNLAKI